jgi:hypothetical protein
MARTEGLGVSDEDIQHIIIGATANLANAETMRSRAIATGECDV